MSDEEIKDLEMTVKEPDLMVPNGLGIEGLEDVPASIIPIPFLRLVQPTSQKVETSKGKDAEPGTFYFNDTQSSHESIKFALIKAKYGMQSFERDGEIQESVKLALLGLTLDTQKLFVITLSVMSFSNFGSLVARMKAAKMVNTWGKAITITSEKQENDKGKYYIARFELGEDLTSEQIADLAAKYTQYGMILDRKVPEQEVTI